MQPEIAILLYMLALVELFLLYVALAVPRPRNPLRRERPPSWRDSVFSASRATRSAAESSAAESSAAAACASPTGSSGEGPAPPRPPRRRTRFRRGSAPFRSASPEDGPQCAPEGEPPRVSI
jgi:hypothetical protein